MTPTTLKDYFFPVEESPVFFRLNPESEAKRYKGIIRQDTDELIAIVGDGYKLVRNEELISSLLDTLEKTDIRYELKHHNRHNYVLNSSMKLTLNFPELKIKDDTKDGLHTSLSIYNSYDMSSRIRAQFGTYRLICSNGAIMFVPEVKTDSKHIASFDVEVIKRRFDAIYNRIPMIEQRIWVLNQLDRKEDIQETIDKVRKDISPSMADFVQKEGAKTMWALYNLFTYYITHQMAVRQHQMYQTKISRMFNI